MMTPPNSPPPHRHSPLKSPLRGRTHSHNGFLRFASIVALASLGWAALFWMESNSRCTQEFPDSPSFYDGEGHVVWKQETHNLRSEYRNESSWRPFLGVDSNDNEEETKIKSSRSQNGFARTIILSKSFGSPLPRLSMQIQDEPEKDRILDQDDTYTHEQDIDQLEHYYLLGQFTDDYLTHCVDMVEWQSKIYPVCNSMHELGFSGGSPSVFRDGIQYLASGSYRMAWSIPNYAKRNAVGPNKVVAKFYHLGDDRDFAYNMRFYEMHRVDAMISERLTASPFVMDIYGYCGMSSITEFAESDLEHAARYHHGGLEDHHENYPINDGMKAMIAAHFVRAVLDVHSVDYPDDLSNSTIVHADIKPSNINFVRRPWGLMAKLGDFNNSFLRKWNVTSQSPCPFRNAAVPLSWGRGFIPPQQSRGEPLDESIDSFAIGGILYYLLLGKLPRDEYPQDKVEQLVDAGKLPPLPRPLRYNDTGFYSNPNPRSANKMKGIMPKTYHQSIPYDGDPEIVRTIVSGIEKFTKVRREDRPSVALANAMFSKYNKCADPQCMELQESQESTTS